MNKRIAVFCGSGTGNKPVYKEYAITLGEQLHYNNLGLVYGGGKIGLMGVIADAVMNLGGEVIGVIPEKIKEMEVAHEGISELHVVDTMHARKALMAAKSDAFIAMPGGIGTLEEIIEVFTWHQLGYHQKPCAFLNVDGYFDPLFEFTNHMVAEGFLKESTKNELIVDSNVGKLVQKILKKI